MRYVRAAALLAVLGSFTFAAGCSGGSGGATPPISTTDQSQLPQPSLDTGAPAVSSSDTTAVTSQSTTSSTGIPSHVMNAAFVYGYGGTPSYVPLSSMSPWINWAFTDTTHAPSLRASHIRVAVYVNYWRNHVDDNPIIGYTDLKPGGAHSAAEVRSCGGSPIWDPTYGGGYASDARKTSPALGHAQILVNYKRTEYGSNWDAMFSDETATFYGMTPPCGYAQSSYVPAVNTVNADLRVPMFLNALGKKLDPYIGETVEPSNVLGAMCEGCYGSNFNNRQNYDTTHDGIWQWIENTEIVTIARHKIFWAYPRMSGPAQDQIAMRKYTYASFLLTYSPSYAMYETALTTGHGFPVMPETGLVPMNPLTTESSVTGYLRSGGAYMREFADCYYRGANHGRCAVVVNPNLSTVRVPTTAYGHSLVLEGSGVLDGGIVSFGGGRVTELTASSAAILFP